MLACISSARLSAEVLNLTCVHGRVKAVPRIQNLLCSLQRFHAAFTPPLLCQLGFTLRS